MSWDAIRKIIEPFESVIRDLKLSMPEGSDINMQYQTVRTFLADQSSLSPEALSAKWSNGDFKRLYDAAIVIFRLARAVGELQRQPQKRLRDTLATVLSGSITQDFIPSQAKDFFYELDLAYRLQRAGFSVTLREPDVVVTGNGLSREIGIACKYPSSMKQIHAHISKGYKQLTGQRLSGVVALGMDLLIFLRIFDRPPHFLDFRGNPKHPLTIAQRNLDDEMVKLTSERPVKYPSECPLDGALLSLDVWGAYGNPAGITEVTAWTFQCDEGNALYYDLCTITKSLSAAFNTRTMNS